MATSSTPPWAAQHAGLLGQADAIAGAGSINQMLGTHPGSQIYGGNQILTPNGTGAGNTISNHPLNVYDIDQVFTMSGTSIGRVQIPVIPIGSGADLIVSLCADNGGNPGTVITRTRIPASWINQLSFASGTDVAGEPGFPILNTTGSALAVPQFNAFRMGQVVGGTWPYPSVNNVGGAAAPASCFNGNYLITVGGVDSSHNALADVFSAYYDANGNLSPAVPTTPLPTVTDGSGKVIIGTDSVGGGPVIVQAGGSTSYGGSTNANVFTAQFDASTGVVSSWSVQASLPYTVQNQGMAAYNGFVYVIAGSTTGTGVINTVAYAQIQNTQITSWTTTEPLPQALQLPYCAVSNGFLFVMGGVNAALSTQYSTCYYAPIYSDGSLGSWQSGPNFPTGGYNLDSTSYGGPFGVITQLSQQNSMMVTADGPAFAWTNENGGGNLFTAYIQESPVTIRVYGASTFGTYGTQAMVLLPNISVPLPAAGLTNGGTYHILMQSPSNDLNNYLTLAWDNADAFSGDPPYRVSARGQYSWSSGLTLAIPITVWDNSNNSATAYGSIGNNQVIHTWDDNGAKITTLVRATTPDQRLIGICEAVASPTALNANSGFESGVSPWTASNGTVTHSSAQAYEGQYSLLLTPTGGFTSAAALSEKVACLPGVSYTVRARAYSPGGYSNVDTQVNWYNSAGTFLSASSTVFNLAAATWTDITAAFTGPANAYMAQIALQEAGSPSSAATIYFDQAWIYETYGGPQVATVAQITYAGTWPSSELWPPTGVLQLA